MLENRDSDLADSDNFESMDFDLRVPNKEHNEDGASDDAEGLQGIGGHLKPPNLDNRGLAAQDLCN